MFTLAGKFLHHILPAVARPVRVLWNQFIGFMFLVIAGIRGAGNLAAGRQRQPVSDDDAVRLRLRPVSGFVRRLVALARAQDFAFLAPLSSSTVVPIHVIGGGLAGSEAALQVARAGLPSILHEMRPVRQTAAHHTDRFAELVCSNSLKSEQENSAPWLLKEELRRLGCFLLEAAWRVRVPAGHALTVDRVVFAEEVSRMVEASPLIEIRREEVVRVPDEGIVIVASGPLTSDALAADIARHHRLGAAVFLRCHQPDCRSRVHRYVRGLSRVALRQVHGSVRRLYQLPVRQACSTSDSLTR